MADWSPEPLLRTVLLGGTLDGDTVNEAAARLMALDGLAGDPITVVVNSPGGPLDDIVGLLDVLDLLRSPVEVTVVGRAHGTAGVLVATAPGRRRIGARASISLRCDAPVTHHGPSGGAVRRAELVQQRLDHLAALVARRTGRPAAWAAAELDRGAIHRAEQAVAWGLVDEVVAGRAAGSDHPPASS